MIGRVLFDSTVNAALAFMGSLALVALVLRLTRRLAGRWQLALLSLPFAKALWELARGVPEGAFFWASARGVAQDMGSFRIGVGFELVRIKIVAALSAVVGPRSFPTSAAEILARGLGKHGWGPWVGVGGFVVVALALLLAARRLVAAVRFARARLRARTRGESLCVEQVGGRSVDVYLADEGSVPFAGGLRRPYVCFPRVSYDALEPDERRAVIAHELAHIRRHDVVTFTLVCVLCDLLWFCPGVRLLRGWIHERLEIDADRGALRSGISAEVLASALVRVKQRQRFGSQPLVAFGAQHGLRKRVTLLLAPVSAPRLSLYGWALRLAIVALTANTILFAVFFGNP